MPRRCARISSGRMSRLRRQHIVTFFLVFLGLGFTLQQWLYFLTLATLVIPAFTLPDIYMIVRHFRPVGEVMAQLDRGEAPSSAAVSRAIVRALNLPFLSFVRVTLFHGPAAAIFSGIAMYIFNQLFGSGFQTWQILGLSLTIFFFASPAHAIFEFFIIARRIAPEVRSCGPIARGSNPRTSARSSRSKLKSKLLYMSIFVNSLPLFFLAATVLFKSDQLFSLGASTSIDQMLPLFQWVIGVVIVCYGGHAGDVGGDGIGGRVRPRASPGDATRRAGVTSRASCG